MKRVSALIAALICMVFVVACNGPKRAETYQPMTASFAWEGNAGSLSSPSPKIIVGNIPAGTAFFEVKMKDLDRKKFIHGGGVVPNDGSGVIPVGALSSYKGPQPPAPEVHTYVFTVTALNADKTMVLGEGRASRKYPER